MVKTARNKNRPILQGPKISIHHVTKKAADPYYWYRFFHGPQLLVIIAIMAGLGFGSYVSWSSKYSDAGSVEQSTGSVLSASTEEPWVKDLEFDASELEVVSNMLPILIEENHREPSEEEVIRDMQKKKLKAYFEKRNSPFADDDSTVEAFLDSKNMNLMIAISFVESTMGKKCYYNNCSGIGGTPPNLRKYDSYAGWVKDFDSLLERRYKGLDIEDFLGLYVQPGSPNWLAGVKQILAELSKEGIR